MGSGKPHIPDPLDPIKIPGIFQQKKTDKGKQNKTNKQVRSLPASVCLNPNPKGFFPTEHTRGMNLQRCANPSDCRCRVLKQAPRNSLKKSAFCLKHLAFFLLTLLGGFKDVLFIYLVPLLGETIQFELYTVTVISFKRVGSTTNYIYLPTDMLQNPHPFQHSNLFLEKSWMERQWRKEQPSFFQTWDDSWGLLPRRA